MTKILHKLLKIPLISLTLILVLTIFFFIQMKSKVVMETNLDKYMPQNHPAFVYSDQAEEWFNIKDGIIIAIENKDGIYNIGTLDKIKQITKDLRKMPEIEKDDITSLYTVDNIVGTEDGMDVKAFYKRIPKSEEKLNDLQQKVKSNEMVFGRLVSVDETVSVIIAQIGDDVFSQEFYNQIIELGNSYEGPEKIYVAGRPIVEGTMALLGPADMKKMVPLVIIIILIVLLFLLKSFKNTLFTLLVVFISTVWTFGLMAFVGIPIYAVSTMIPVMLIAIGVADGIHLYSHLSLFLYEHPNATRKEAVMDMLTSMWKPVVMTSITTAVGFISLLTSQVYPIKYFGLFTAFGVLSAMVLSLVMIPAGLMVFKLPKSRNILHVDMDDKRDRFADKFSSKLIKNRFAVVTATVIIIVISLIGIQKVWINSSFLDKFEKNSDIVLTDKFINENFGGTSMLNVILESENKNAFKNPNTLRFIDEIQKDIESLDIVGSSFSLGDYLKRMNKVMNADNEEFNTIPDSPELIAQYLLLYEISGDPENLWKVTDYEFRKLNITFQIKSDNSKEMNRVIDRLEQYRAKLYDNNIEMKYAGSGYKALVFTDLILEGQITSLLLSLIIIVILLSIMFKKISAGLIGSVPIVITSIISFGVMGLLNIPLSTLLLH
ncbi:MAG: MMPL family transporter [Planctomycetia bacterium]|nr:MMPL family transporter [Planctomycetia bacterium]